MIPGSIKVETDGSYWWIDEDGMRYLRTPKQEGPRWSPDGEDWGGQGAGGLEDLRWHPMFGWEIRPGLFGARLLIQTTDEGEDSVYVVAPGARRVGEVGRV